MGFFKKLTKGVIDTALLPLDIVRDTLTLGGAITDEEPATKDRLKKVLKDLEDTYDSLDED